MRVSKLIFGFLGGAVLAGSPVSAVAQTAGYLDNPPVRPGYQPPRTPDGHPDFSGVWTNASSTPMERPVEYGEQLVLSDEEMAAIEQATFTRNARINAPTAKEVQENWVQIAKGPDTLDECRGGSLGVACGYNAGWTDPGDWVMRVDGKGRTSLITYPANGRMPERIAGSEVGRARIATSGEDSEAGGEYGNPEDLSIAERCIMVGMMSGPVMQDGLYNNTYQFVQTGDHLAIWVEMVHDVRIVRINGEHRNDGVRPWMGDSIGWWDGDTLVVETVDYHPDQRVRGAGPKLKVTERFTRVSDDRMHYAFRAEDPETWVEPWGGEYEFASVDGQVFEYACHEGNYGLEGILTGARYRDRVAAQ